MPHEELNQRTWTPQPVYVVKQPEGFLHQLARVGCVTWLCMVGASVAFVVLLVIAGLLFGSEPVKSRNLNEAIENSSAGTAQQPAGNRNGSSLKQKR